jgi:hypothetical protein
MAPLECLGPAKNPGAIRDLANWAYALGNPALNQNDVRLAGGLAAVAAGTSALSKTNRLPNASF